MPAIAYYITAHGYGHTTRSLPVIRALKRASADLDIHIRSVTPQRFFDDLGFPVFYHHGSIDVGFLQRDGLEMDVEGTFYACQALHDRMPRLIEEELAFIRRENVRLILGDIPPLCFEVAARASLPSVAVTNFTWDWIYRSYLDDRSSFLRLIQELEGFYRRATLALCLPYSCDMEVFAEKVPIPLIVRTSRLSQDEARRRFGLALNAKIVLVSFGGYGLERMPWERLERLGDFFFVSTAATPKKGKNFIILPEALPHYVDLVRAADVVISKPGYGIVADVIAHRTPILYTSRGKFPEYPFLVQALSDWATSEFIPQEEVLQGNLGPYLMRLLEKNPNWPAVPLDGAEVAARKVLELLLS